MKHYHLQNRPNREIATNQEITEILGKGKFAVISMCRYSKMEVLRLDITQIHGKAGR